MNSPMKKIERVLADIGANPDDLDRRKSFVGFTDQDAGSLRSLRPFLDQEYAKAFADAFYVQLREYAETNVLLQDEKTVERLKAAQAAYFIGLTAGE